MLRSIRCQTTERYHVPEGLGVLSCSLILKMKLVPPPLLWSSRVPSFYIVMLVLVVYLCPSSVRVVATFSGIVLFPLLYFVLLFFP